MANVGAAARNAVWGDYDTTADTSAITVGSNVLVDLSLDFGTGSGSGTVIVQRKTHTAAAGTGVLTWQDVDSFTGDTEKVYTNASQRDMRLSITVSAGSIAFELAGGGRGY